jgi:hypothetical protein
MADRRKVFGTSRTGSQDMRERERVGNWAVAFVSATVCAVFVCCNKQSDKSARATIAERVGVSQTNVVLSRDLQQQVASMTKEVKWSERQVLNKSRAWGESDRERERERERERG